MKAKSEDAPHIIGEIRVIEVHGPPFCCWWKTAEHKQTAAIWAEKLGDAYVGCYGLLDDLDREKDGTVEEQNAIGQAAELIAEAQALLEKVAGFETE